MGATYNPSNPKLLLANLQTIYTKSFSQQESVNTLVGSYSVAVDISELIFAPINKKTRLHRVYKSNDGATQAQL